LVAPDTSPRGSDVPDDKDSWDFGVAAGFYLDATQEPWSKYYKMESYIVDELVSLVRSQFPVDAEKIGIFGHSMGGHGALTLALRHQDVFRSVSAFAPICAPTRCPWGHKAFSGYLSDNRAAWEEHDASILMSRANMPFPQGILVDQGLADNFLPEQLYPEAFEEACQQANQPLTLRRHEGYDHRSEEHTSELQSRENLVCRLLLEKKNKMIKQRLDKLEKRMVKSSAFDLFTETK